MSSLRDWMQIYQVAPNPTDTEANYRLTLKAIESANVTPSMDNITAALSLALGEDVLV